MGMNPQTTYGFTAVTGAYTAAPADVALVTTGTATVTVTLPKVSTCYSPVVVRKVDSATGTAAVVTADGSTIDGVTGTTGVSTSTQHAGWTFAPNGANWNIVAS